MSLDVSTLAVCLVTDAGQCAAAGRSVAGTVANAVANGVRSVQVRAKDASGAAFLDEVTAVAEAIAAVPGADDCVLIVNDRVDVAVAAEADGVHLGQDDLSPEDVRRWLPHALVGLSIERAEQLAEAERLPVDYYGASPVFATTTKTDTAAALGLEGLRALRARCTRPLVAIGGIDAHNAAAVMAAGADGLAVVSALCAAPDPEAAARRLRAAMEKGCP